MSMRLYQITDTSNPGKNLAVGNMYFSDKVSAKTERKKLNTEAGTETRFVVSPGPDHKNYQWRK